MTREDFIWVLDEYNTRYIIDGQNIILNSDNPISMRFPGDTYIPSGVTFKNRGYVRLSGIISIEPGVEFNNGGELIISPILKYGNGYLKHHQFYIDGIEKKRLFNLMISRGVFI